MESLYLLIPIALLFLAVAVGLFVWAVNRRQFDDLERQGRSILFERDSPDRTLSNPEPSKRKPTESDDRP